MSITPGQHLKQIMKEEKITQQELANRVGLARSTVGMYVSGNALPSRETWIKIIKALESNLGESLMIYDNFRVNLCFEKSTAAKEAVREQFGNDVLELLNNALNLTPEGLKKLNERAEELLEIKRYNASAEEYEADSAKDRPEYYGYNPNEEDGK